MIQIIIFNFSVAEAFVGSFADTWKKFKGENIGDNSQTTVCDDGIREIVNYLNPKHTEDMCSP